MQRLNNRSAHAPVGTAFFLFLGLAILPVSLRVAGVQVSFSPRLSAATDAWQQIAEVFGASYNPAPSPELCVVKELDADPFNPTEDSVSPGGGESRCTHRAQQSYDTAVEVPKPRAPRAAAALRDSLDPASRRPLTASRVSLVVAAEAIKASFEKRGPAIAALGAMKLETLTREHLVKSIENQAFMQSFESIGEIRSAPAPKNVRVLVRLKRAAGFSAKTAECKVFSALASTRQRECERAMVTSTLSSTPDNSEF